MSLWDKQSMAHINIRLYSVILHQFSYFLTFLSKLTLPDLGQ